MNRVFLQSEIDITGFDLDEETLQIEAYRDSIYYSILEDKERKKTKLYIYAKNIDEMSVALLSLKKLLPKSKIHKKRICEKNYLLKYLKTYKPISVGSYMIVPYFHKKNIMTNKTKVFLNPGFSFGTGDHPTTKLVLKLMSKYCLSDKKVLDCGTGSGILSFAAEKSRASHVTGFDIDDSILYSTRENAVLNKSKICSFILGSLDDTDLKQKYDIILVNMLSKEFKQFMHKLSFVSYENTIILVSGILNEEEREIEKYFKKTKLKIVHKELLKGWLGYSLQFYC